MRLCKSLGIAAICLGWLAVGGNGCGSSETEASQAYQWQVSEGDVEKVPYQMTGEKDGWSVQCSVREATEAEKKEILQKIEMQRAVIEENYRVHREITEEQYQMFQEQFMRQEQDVKDETVYLTSITGCYGGESNLEEETDLFYYQILDGEGRSFVSGGVDARSVNGEWYRSENTGSGYFSNAFLPPLEGGLCRIDLGNQTIEIPLVLEPTIADAAKFVKTRIAIF